MATAQHAPRDISQGRDRIALSEHPQTFALKQPTNGKEVGQFGSVMYTASDGRVLFVVADDASDFHHQMVDMGIRPNEPISVTRVKVGGRGGGYAIRVRRVSDADEGPSDRQLVDDLERSVASAQAQRNRRMSGNGTGVDSGTPVPPLDATNTRTHHNAAESPSFSPAAAKLAGALKSAIDAVVEAKFYASRLGLSLEFDKEDVRCLAVTAFIQSSKGGS